MGNSALLSPSDVHVIRRYVQTKYAPLSEARRAEIVATAIRETLHRRLPELPDVLKGQIADELIRRCLVSERREIKPDDVLDACARIELPAPESEYLILDPVLRWMNEKAPGVWNPEQLFVRLFKRSLIPINHDEVAAALETPVRADPPVPGNLPFAWKNLIARVPRMAWAMTAAVLAGGMLTGVLTSRPSTLEQPNALGPPPSIAIPSPAADIGMPQALRFRNIDTAAIKRFLESRDSMLAEEPYFDAIVESARVHDVNPLLLFAITGQEQGFVPKTNKNARKIANNPFNVYHSWEDFNTNIAHSSDVAARTVSRRGSKRPEGHEPFRWLNLTYAEDPNWADGVKQIFEQLETLK